MGYRTMEELNHRYGVGPKIPELKEYAKGTDFKSCVIRFFYNRCEGLAYDFSKNTDDRTGKSNKPGVIPFNMEKDIDRLCMQKAMERFLDSGRAADAFDVYFCYLEMFFGAYEKTRKMIEMLSEYEINGSALLMKHRDHYSHSVYVFALGLAVFDTSKAFRRAYAKAYRNKLGTAAEDSSEAANHFLKYWGLTSLFHDIGYPFELPFEQVEAYFESADRDGYQRKDGKFHIAYTDVNTWVAFSKEEQGAIQTATGKLYDTTDDLFTDRICEKLAANKDIYEILQKPEELKKKLQEKTSAPKAFHYFMDHAYFSANILLRQILENREEALKEEDVDAVVAILLHNSLFKRTIAHNGNYNDEDNIPFPMENDPLAYLLMLCDELQCWDRNAYGRNSRTQLHPMECQFVFRDNGIFATYLFDRSEQYRIDEAVQKKDKKSVKPYFSFVKENGMTDVECDIRKIVGLADRADPNGTQLYLNIDANFMDKKSVKRSVSSSRYMHLYDFAVVLNGRYVEQYKKNAGELNRKEHLSKEDLYREFDKLSLEYKMSNVLQAKEFANHLDKIGCFYSDVPNNNDLVWEFSKEQLIEMAKWEHIRWNKEKTEMEWRYADRSVYNEIGREILRLHELVIDGFERLGEKQEECGKEHFEQLPVEEKLKDGEPLNLMLEMLRQEDGVSIYQFVGGTV